MVGITVLETASCRLDEVTPKPEPASPIHSPFVLHVSTDALPFQRISMKDVGMSIAPSDRDHVYEQLAVSLSSALAHDEELPMSTEVLYSTDVEAPSAVYSCGIREVYVDLWQPDGQERWGYSLWSGCATDDQFAHHEVARDQPDDFTGLTRSIAHALREAVKTRCFTRRC